jgi:hypothetical protein
MKRVELTVRGDRASEVPSAFADVPLDRRESYSGDGFVTLVVESPYRAELAELQGTIVMAMPDETTCEVTLIVGGGGAGLLGDDVGREAEEARKLRRRVETFCDEAGLRVERE